VTFHNSIPWTQRHATKENPIFPRQSIPLKKAREREGKKKPLNLFISSGQGTYYLIAY
jgi:hypothetical protein